MAAVTMIAEKFSEKASQNHIAFTTELEPITALLWGDPILFEQAVLNVLNNALLHGGEEMDRISLTVNENTDAIVIAVRDNGVGIAPVDHDVALGRFGQIGPSVGSGLGLPIAKAIAEAFGGRVELVNATNAFTVKLMFPKDQSD